jgi:hypothetical protein
MIDKGIQRVGGNLNITWFDRFVELLEDGEEFSLYKHIQYYFLPKIDVWTDNNVNLCGCNNVQIITYLLILEIQFQLLTDSAAEF